MSSRKPAIAVKDERGLRTLHVGGEAIQSSMRIAEPHALALDYTRCMMLFLLFHPEPREALMIGLGGGSLPKFFHKYFRKTNIRVVEIDPRVVAAARRHFALPPDDARLSVEIGDGAEALAPECCDLLMVDAFHDEEHVPKLASSEFYDAAWLALREPGALVVNFMDDDRRFDRHLQRVERAFGGAVLAVPALYDPNIIVFAFKGVEKSFEWQDLRLRAAALESRLGLPFLRYVSRLRSMNRCTPQELLRFGMNPPDYTLIATLAAIAFAGALIFGVTGFGSALVAIPLATHLVPLPFALALFALSDLVCAFSVGLENPRKAVRAEWMRLVPMILVGTVLGVTLLVNLPRATGMLLLGLFILSFSLYSLKGHATMKPVKAGWGWFAGLAGGLTSSLFGAGGPPYVIYLSHRGLSKEEFRATLGLTTMTSISLRVVAFLLTGLLLQSAVWLAAAAVVPAALAALYLAKKIYLRITREQLMRAVAVLLLGSGASLIWRALSQM